MQINKNKIKNLKFTTKFMQFSQRKNCFKKHKKLAQHHIVGPRWLLDDFSLGDLNLSHKLQTLQKTGGPILN